MQNCTNTDLLNLKAVLVDSLASPNKPIDVNIHSLSKEGARMDLTPTFDKEPTKKEDYGMMAHRVLSNEKIYYFNAFKI